MHVSIDEMGRRIFNENLERWLIERERHKFSACKIVKEKEKEKDNINSVDENGPHSHYY